VNFKNTQAIELQKKQTEIAQEIADQHDRFRNDQQFKMEQYKQNMRFMKQF